MLLSGGIGDLRVWFPSDRSYVLWKLPWVLEDGPGILGGANCPSRRFRTSQLPGHPLQFSFWRFSASLWCLHCAFLEASSLSPPWLSTVGWRMKLGAFWVTLFPGHRTGSTGQPSSCSCPWWRAQGQRPSSFPSPRKGSEVQAASWAQTSCPLPPEMSPQAT